MTDCGHGALIASGEARGLCPLCQRAEIGRLRHRRHELENALNGLLGLITLICDRDDVPPLLRDAIITSHRTREAGRVIDAARGALEGTSRAHKR